MINNHHAPFLLASLVCAMFMAMPVTGFAATAKCHPYSALLEGTTNTYGVSYKERVFVHKTTAGKSYRGKWKIDKYEQILTYPNRLPAIPIPTKTHKFGKGLWMTCSSRILGNVIHIVCAGNLSFYVVGNKIRFAQTNTYNGSVTGNKMSFKFGMQNPLEPMKTGTMQKGPQKPIQLSIQTTPGHKYKFKFSNQTQGKLQFQIKAKVTPQRYAKDVVWTIPKIQGSTRTMVPANAKGETIKVTYEGLPKRNSEFGKKQVKAKLKVGSCEATENHRVQIYYDLLAKNNPEGKYPNWFYYWKQTPAARPGGQKPIIMYGGRTFKHCRYPGVPAQYIYNLAYKGLHVCDLSKFGATFETTFPVINRYWRKKWIAQRTVTFIDTFATAIIHEYKHFEHYHAWRYGKSDSKIRSEDKDNDGIPDRLEPGMKFDPNKVQTHLPIKLSKIGYDEEWLAYEAMRHYKPGSYDKYDWAAPGKQW